MNRENLGVLFLRLDWNDGPCENWHSELIPPNEEVPKDELRVCFCVGLLLGVFKKVKAWRVCVDKRKEKATDAFIFLRCVEAKWLR